MKPIRSRIQKTASRRQNGLKIGDNGSFYSDRILAVTSKMDTGINAACMRTESNTKLVQLYASWRLLMEPYELKRATGTTDKAHMKYNQTV